MTSKPPAPPQQDRQHGPASFYISGTNCFDQPRHIHHKGGGRGWKGSSSRTSGDEEHCKGYQRTPTPKSSYASAVSSNISPSSKPIVMPTQTPSLIQAQCEIIVKITDPNTIENLRAKNSRTLQSHIDRQFNTILSQTQRLLEECCYDFAERWLSSILDVNGWDAPEVAGMKRNVELSVA
jgi:hypothetical protein